MAAEAVWVFEIVKYLGETGSTTPKILRGALNTS